MARVPVASCLLGRSPPGTLRPATTAVVLSPGGSMRRVVLAVGLALIVPLAPARATAPAQPAVGELPPLPPTPQRPVSHTYHGVTVVDPYEWLERGDDPEVQAWTKAQDAHARAWLARVPGIDWIRERVRVVPLAKQTSFVDPVERGGRLFAARSQPPAAQPVVVAMSGPAGAAGARVILDPQAIDRTGDTAFDWFVPSLDGKLRSEERRVGKE